MARITVTELAQTLVTKHKMTQKDAEQFVRFMFLTAGEGLDSDKLVKIKGLGTFKVLTVKPRESINVRTGERVVIDSHDKINFTPDARMKELVNKPFAQFETVPVSDGVATEILEEPEAVQDEIVVEEPEFSPLDMPIEEPSVQPENNTTELYGIKAAYESPEEKKNDIAELGNSKISLSDNDDTTDTSAGIRINVEERAIDSVEIETPLKSTVLEFPQKQEESIDEDDEVLKIPVPENPIRVEIPKKKPQKQNVLDPVAPNSTKEEPNEPSKKNNTRVIIVGLLIVAVIVGIGLLIGTRDMTSQLSQETPKPEVTGQIQKPKVEPTPKPVADPYSVKPMAEYMKDPRIKYGAYDIVGIQDIVTLKQGETMQDICNRTLGNLMICYFEAVNERKEFTTGDKIRVPKVVVRRKK
jgi:nucleoid DNA-binding protein